MVDCWNSFLPGVCDGAARRTGLYGEALVELCDGVKPPKSRPPRGVFLAESIANCIVVSRNNKECKGRGCAVNYGMLRHGIFVTQHAKCRW